MASVHRHCSVCGRPCAGHPGRYGPTCVLPHISTISSTSADSTGNNSESYYTPSGTQQSTQFQFTSTAATTAAAGQAGPLQTEGGEGVPTSTSTSCPGRVSTTPPNMSTMSNTSATSTVPPAGMVPYSSITGGNAGVDTTLGVTRVSGVIGVTGNQQVPSF